jgi:hypothetical protein
MGAILIDSSGHVLTAPFKANFESFVSSEEQKLKIIRWVEPNKLRISAVI